MRGLSGDAWRADRAVPSGFVLSRSFPDLVGDFFLVFASLVSSLSPIACPTTSLPLPTTTVSQVAGDPVGSDASGHETP
jgi:hypothetical protein